MKRFVVLFLSFFWVLVSFSAPVPDDVADINAKFVSEGLVQASVELGDDGRVRLKGQYKDRAQVQLAFHLAQQVVGVKWVAPTTPENVRYPGTAGMKNAILAALRKSRPAQMESLGPGEVHALIVGVGHYKMKLNPIPNAGDDAKQFYKFLDGRNIKRENMTLLLEENATKARVNESLAGLERRVRPNDTVVLYFSTHGDKPNDKGNLSIVLHDTKVDKERKWVDPATVLQDDEIKRFIEAVSPARVMVVLDVCYSGAAFDKVPGFLASSSKDLFVEEQSFATGVDRQNLTYVAGQYGEQQKLLIAASGPGEKSWNSGQLKQGYFTYYFVRELDRKGDVQGAYDSAKPLVVDAVKTDPSIQTGKTVPISQTPQGTFIPESANFRF